ncbi:MAG: hypothetical protein APR62_00735 [Smithella sp. SDB]|nr:MAG: hypothetical protein APR62_00735 [Smithella sp. SDB]
MIFRVKNIFKIFSMLIIMISVFSVSQIMALETDTHRDINESIVQNGIGGFSLDNYLKNQLGMQDGKDTFINNKAVFKWIGDGGEFEDDGLRPRSHFLNPLTNQGLVGICYSALEWATLPVGVQGSEHYS